MKGGVEGVQDTRTPPISLVEDRCPGVLIRHQDTRTGVLGHQDRCLADIGHSRHQDRCPRTPQDTKTLGQVS